jgi:hypothetical protein
MKKIVVLCLTLVMVASLALTAFAAPGAFTVSPWGNPAPELISGTPVTEGCTGKLVITPYSQKNTLDEATRLVLEEAYDQIANNTVESAFTTALAALAAAKEMEVSELSVSDLFDVSYIGCNEHGEHDGFVITLKTETLQSFVGLMHFNGQTWETLDAEWDAEAGTVTFAVETLSPFAIVVDNGTGEQPPQTGDRALVLYGAVMAVTAAGLALVLVSLKKKKA